MLRWPGHLTSLTETGVGVSGGTLEVFKDVLAAGMDPRNWGLTLMCANGGQEKV